MYSRRYEKGKNYLAPSFLIMKNVSTHENINVKSNSIVLISLEIAVRLTDNIWYDNLCNGIAHKFRDSQIP